MESQIAQLSVVDLNETPVSSKSVFGDHHWHLDMASPLTQRNIMKWDYVLPGGHGRFTDQRHADWLWSCKMIVFAMLTGNYGEKRKTKTSTAFLQDACIRQLVQWMASRDLIGFQALNADDILSYRNFVESRHRIASSSGNVTNLLEPAEAPSLSCTQLAARLSPLRHLLMLRDVIPFQPAGDPLDLLDLVKIERKEGRRTEHIPDDVAIRLFGAAIRWVTDYGPHLAAAYTAAMSAYAGASPGNRVYWANRARLAYFRDNELTIEFAQASLTVTGGNGREFMRLLVLLETACFIIIAGMVGLRVSEAASLLPGCLESIKTDGCEKLLLLNGLIFKTAPEGQDSHPWRWVAGWDNSSNPVRRAIETLERIRQIENVRSPRLFVGTHGRRAGEVDGLGSHAYNLRVNAFARSNGIIGWTFASHQFRKTFARFVTKRDFTGLVALKQHFGHISLQMTEHYGYWDDDLIAEVLDADVEQDFEALDIVLSSDTLAGKMGERVASNNHCFRGIAGEEARRLEIDRLQTELSDDPLIIMRHEYGYCVYTQEQAACGGEAWRVGPPTCMSCPNAVFEKVHLPWWEREKSAHEESLAAPTFEYLTAKAKEGLRRSYEAVCALVAKLKDMPT